MQGPVSRVQGCRVQGPGMQGPGSRVQGPGTQGPGHVHTPPPNTEESSHTWSLAGSAWSVRVSSLPRAATQDFTSHDNQWISERKAFGATSFNLGAHYRKMDQPFFCAAVYSGKASISAASLHKSMELSRLMHMCHECKKCELAKLDGLHNRVCWISAKVNRLCVSLNCLINGYCIPTQFNGSCTPAQVNGCCIPAQGNGSCLPVQFNGCCTRIPAQVNGRCIPIKVNGCCSPAQDSGCCFPTQLNGFCIPAQVNGYCVPTQVSGLDFNVQGSPASLWNSVLFVCDVCITE